MGGLPVTQGCSPNPRTLPDPHLSSPLWLLSISSVHSFDTNCAPAESSALNKTEALSSFAFYTPVERVSY